MAVLLLSLLIGSALALQSGTLLTALVAAMFFSALVVSAVLIQPGPWEIFLTLMADILVFNIGFMVVLAVRLGFRDIWRP